MKTLLPLPNGTRVMKVKNVDFVFDRYVCIQFSHQPLNRFEQYILYSITSQSIKVLKRFAYKISIKTEVIKGFATFPKQLHCIPVLYF